MNRKIIPTVCILLGCISPSTFATMAVHDPLLQVAPERTWAFSVRGELALLEGEAIEQVFIGDYKLSELTWDMTGLAIGGVAVSALYGPRLGFNAGVWTALNRGDGEMTDYDWMQPGRGWSEYSRSEVEIDESLILDINATYLFHQGSRSTWRWVVGFKYEHWAWIDSAQEYIYSSPTGFRDIQGHFGGVRAIDYDQTFRIPYFGLNLDGQLGNEGRLAWSAYLLYSPFVRAVANDFHILRDTKFRDSFSNGNFYAFGLSGTYALNNTWSLAAHLRGQSIPEQDATGYIRDEARTPYDAGIGNQYGYFALSLSAQF